MNLQSKLHYMSRRDVVAKTKLVTYYSHKGEIDYARKLFDEMPHRDSVTWNIMIKCYIDNHMVGDARDVFDRMHDLRNIVSWNSMIMAYTHQRKTPIALKLFLVMPRKDVISWTTIVSGLCRDSRIMDAYRLFKQMPEPNSVSWSSIISGFQQNGLAAETLSLFKEMSSRGVQPTSHSFTSALTASAELAVVSVGEQLYSHVLKRGFEGNNLVENAAITMYMKCGCFDNARRVFIEMPLLDTVTWNSMIVGYAQHGCAREAISMFHQMQKAQFRPDDISFLGVLQGCAHCGFVEQAFTYFKSMQTDWGISLGPEHYACIVDVLARAGFLEEAYEMITTMPFQPVAAICWRTLLNGCRMWGGVELGVLAASEVLKLEPSSASAYLMVIEMYVCAGKFKEAVEIRRRMRGRGSRKEAAFSWIEIKDEVHVFTTKDETHVASDAIYMILELLSYGLVENNI